METHITIIERVFSEHQPLSKVRRASCLCGWQGFERSTMALAANDAVEHERTPARTFNVGAWRVPVAGFSWHDRPYINSSGSLVSSVRVGLHSPESPKNGWWAQGWRPDGGDEASSLWVSPVWIHDGPLETAEQAMECADNWLRGDGAIYYREKVQTTYTDVDKDGFIVEPRHPDEGMRLVDCHGYREGIDIGRVVEVKS